MKIVVRPINKDGKKMDDPIHFHGILEDAMTNRDLLHRKKQAYDMKAFMLENEVVDSRLIEKSS